MNLLIVLLCIQMQLYFKIMLSECMPTPGNWKFAWPWRELNLWPLAPADLHTVHNNHDDRKHILLIADIEGTWVPKYVHHLPVLELIGHHCSSAGTRALDYQLKLTFF
jgi:hypothetical protein